MPAYTHACILVHFQRSHHYTHTDIHVRSCCTWHADCTSLDIPFLLQGRKRKHHQIGINWYLRSSIGLCNYQLVGSCHDCTVIGYTVCLNFHQFQMHKINSNSTLNFTPDMYIQHSNIRCRYKDEKTG